MLLLVTSIVEDATEQDATAVDDTEIYDEKAVDHESDRDTHIYTDDDIKTLADSPAFCPDYGKNLNEISNPTYCHSCGTEL